jgi:integrase
MVYVQMCLGLRVSELLALKWSDVDWLNGEIPIQRAVVMQNVGDVKTEASQKPLPLSDELRELLQQWKRTTDFSSESDWIFASPYQIGRLPYSYPWFLREIQKAATDAGIGTFGTHTHRHTYRSWLDAEGTKIAVQQKLMRHADIGTSMNGYGDVVTNEMAEANAKVSRLAFNSGQLIA